MYSFIETMGIIFCFGLVCLTILCAYYVMKSLAKKLIKKLRDPRRCPNCGCIPLGFRSKNTNKKWSSDFCPHCGLNLMFADLKDEKTVCDTCAMSEEDRDIC